jgi:hypothetical protein
MCARPGSTFRNVSESSWSSMTRSRDLFASAFMPIGAAPSQRHSNETHASHLRRGPTLIAWGARGPAHDNPNCRRGIRCKARDKLEYDAAPKERGEIACDGKPKTVRDEDS